MRAKSEFEVVDGDVFVRAGSYLRTREISRIIEVHRSLKSTNERARELARKGALHGTTVFAHTQTEGRGQRGRTWHSPPGLGLYVSFILRPSPAIPPRKAPTLTLLAGLAVRDAITRSFAIEPVIKWPNDLLAPRGSLYGRKLAGVLVEVAADPLKIDHAVIGVGVNLREGERPAAIAHSATSLEAIARSMEGIETPKTPRASSLDRFQMGRVLAAIAGELEDRLDQAEREGFGAILDDWRHHAAGRGEDVSILLDGETLKGRLEDIGEDGALVLRFGDSTRAFYRGELRLPGAPVRIDEPGPSR